MKQLIQARVVGGTRYQFDGIEGAKVWILQPASDDNPDTVGQEVMEVSAWYGAVDVLRKHPLPGDFEIEAEMRRASKNKVALYVTGLRPVVSVKSTQVKG